MSSAYTPSTVGSCVVRLAPQIQSMCVAVSLRSWARKRRAPRERRMISKCWRLTKMSSNRLLASSHVTIDSVVMYRET